MTADVSIELPKAPYRSIDYMHRDKLRSQSLLSKHVPEAEDLAVSPPSLAQYYHVYHEIPLEGRSWQHSCSIQ